METFVATSAAAAKKKIRVAGVRVDPGLWIKARTVAFRSGIRWDDFMTEAITQHINRTINAAMKSRKERPS